MGCARKLPISRGRQMRCGLGYHRPPFFRVYMVQNVRKDNDSVILGNVTALEHLPHQSPGNATLGLTAS